MKKTIISVVLLFLSICCFCEETEYFNVVVLDKNSRELLDNKVEYVDASVSLKDTTGNIVLITNDISFNKNKEDIFYIPLDYLKDKEIIINTEDKTDTYNENHIVILAKTDYAGPFCDVNSNKFLSFTKENNGETITYGLAKFYRNVENNHYIKSIEDSKNDSLESIKQTSPKDINIFSRTTEIIDYGIDTKECYVTTIMKYDDSYKKINLDYTKDEFEIKDKKLISYNRSNTSVTIPDGVEEISAGAFQSNKSIMEVIIPNSCKKIDEYAFNNCQNLEKVNLENIDEIGQGAFAYCLDLRKNINFSNSLKVINNSTFSNCNILKLKIPNSIKIIGEYAFSENSNIEELVIEKGVKKIEKSAFACFDDNHNKSLKKLIIPGSVESIGEYAFQCYSNIEELVIEDGVKKIEKGAFLNVETTANKSLKKLIIPNTVEIIGAGAFQCYPNIEKLIIEKGVKKIEKGAFSNLESTVNKSLKKLVIPSSVESIGEFAFQCYSNIEELIIENGVKKIEQFAFVNSEATVNKSLKKLVIPGSVEIISENAFQCYSNIEELIIENGVKKIENGAFINTDTIPNKSLKKLVIPSSVEVIGEYAFSENSNIEELIIENGVKRIEKGVFFNTEKSSNKYLKKLIIPNTVEIIGAGAFQNYSNIEELIIENGVKKIEQFAFANLETTANKSLKKLIIPSSVGSIGESAFQCYSNIEELIIENGVKKIEQFAFANSEATANKSLKKLVIPSSVEVIGKAAFLCYSNIEELVIEDGVKKIEKGAFNNLESTVNKSLKKLVIPSSVEVIGEAAFQNYSNIEELIIENGVKEIKYGAFLNLETTANKSLKKLIIPNTVEIIGAGAFQCYSNIEELVI